MFNKVLWTIDYETPGSTFERLCIDLLYRSGYRDIVPIEPQDGGRDAEEFPRSGRGRSGEPAFFQFSLEHNWKSKLRRDARKLHTAGNEFTSLVFVTNQKSRGVDIDALRKELRREYQWELIVYSRAWLRLQLEEVHPDLAKKYLDVEVPNWSRHLSALLWLKKSPDEGLSQAWNAFHVEAYERAAVEFKAYLDEQPELAHVWQALAWAQYQSYHYDEALASINRAIRLRDDTHALSIRACILTEKGIRERDKSLVMEARRLFEQVLASTEDPTWTVFYNLGNVLGALGEHEDAIHLYKQALRLEEHEPKIWKNLASAYHLVDDHESEMKCFDRVLELDPTQPEALVSKGVSLLIDFGEAAEAVALLEQALKFDPAWAIQWPHVWYWLGEACYQDERPKQALRWVEEGLDHQPGQMALRRLKSDLLMELLGQESGIVEEARRFWSVCLLEEPLDFDIRTRLVQLEVEQGEVAIAWNLLEEFFEKINIENIAPLRASGFAIEECITALRFLPQYRVYREQYPISDYWQQEDPLYDLPFPPLVSNQLMAALTTYFSVPFGIGLQALAEAEDCESMEILSESFDVIRPRVEHALVEAARYLADFVPPRSESTGVVADKIIEVIRFLGLIALREFGRQRGWIASQFRVPAEALNDACASYDEAQIEVNVMINSLRTLNEVTGFAPDC
jgi:tetratricopeptide (TPR) repeat protein